jgi:hypothetical protein
VIAQADEILTEYSEQGFVVTLRQLYYQFVSRDLLENTPKAYKRLGDIVSQGRLAGLLDWDAIEDRGRKPRTPAEWASIDEIVKVAVDQFRLPRWKGQVNYVECWIEKEALAAVLEPLGRAHHVTICVNKGYSSQSAMRVAAGRYLDAACEGLAPVLLYLGDHDPSGEDMVRDIGDRLEVFGVAGLRLEKVALTMAQIREYDPPPNPAKTTDSRYAKYAEKHGDESWELDALEPRVLQTMIRSAIERFVDKEELRRVLAEEEAQKVRMRAAIARMNKAKR